MKRWLALAPLLVLGLLAVLFATYGLHHDPHVTPAALVGKPLPDRTLSRLDGDGPVRLRSMVQGPTVVTMFASWCVPCIEDQPALLAMKAEGVRIVGIAYKDDPAKSQAFLARYGDPFAEVLSDRDGAAGLDLGVSGVPETFVVSPDLQITAKHSGPLQPTDVEDLMTALGKAGR